MRAFAGFPGWVDKHPICIGFGPFKALGNSVAIPCVEFVMKGIATVLKIEKAKHRRRQSWSIAACFPMAA